MPALAPSSSWLRRADAVARDALVNLATDMPRASTSRLLRLRGLLWPVIEALEAAAEEDGDRPGLSWSSTIGPCISSISEAIQAVSRSARDGEDDDDGDEGASPSSSSALALALLASSWRASFEGEDGGDSRDPIASLGGPPALRSWAFAATVSALDETRGEEGGGDVRRRNECGNSWSRAAARLSLLTLSPPAELAALASGAVAAACSPSGAMTRALVSEVVSWALVFGGGGGVGGATADDCVVAEAAATAAAAGTAATAAATLGIVIEPLARFLRVRLEEAIASSANGEGGQFSCGTAAAAAEALDELLSAAPPPTQSTLLLSRLASLLARAVASLLSSSPVSTQSVLVAPLCRLRARLALCGLTAAAGSEEADEEERDGRDGGGGTSRAAVATTSSRPPRPPAPLWATMLSPPPSLSRSLAGAPRDERKDTKVARAPGSNVPSVGLAPPPDSAALAAAAACAAALPGSPLRPWKETSCSRDCVDVLLASASPLRDSSHPVCRVAAAAASWIRAPIGSPSPAPSSRCLPVLLLYEELSDLAVSAASAVPDRAARAAMVTAVVSSRASSGRERSPPSSSGSSSSSPPASAAAGEAIARAAVTSAVNRARDGGELARAIVAASLAVVAPPSRPRSAECPASFLRGLVASGAADDDAGKLVSSALAEAWPEASALLLPPASPDGAERGGAEGGREEGRGRADGRGRAEADEALCSLLWRCLLAANRGSNISVSSFVAFAARLAGCDGAGGGRGGQTGKETRRRADFDGRSSAPLPPPAALEGIVLRALEDPEAREQDDPVSCAARLGVLLLRGGGGGRRRGRARGAGGLGIRLLSRIVETSGELFSRRGGRREALLSPSTSSLCGELAAAAAASASACSARSGGDAFVAPPMPWRARLAAPSLLLPSPSAPLPLPPSLAPAGEGEEEQGEEQQERGRTSALLVASDLLAIAWGSEEGEEAVVRAAEGRRGRGRDAVEDGAVEGDATDEAAGLLLSHLRSFGIRGSHEAIEEELSRVLPVLSSAEAERLTTRALPAVLRSTSSSSAAGGSCCGDEGSLSYLPRSAFRALAIQMLCRVAATPPTASPSLVRAALRAATAAARSGPPALARRASSEAASLAASLRERASKGGGRGEPALALAEACVPSLLQMISCVVLGGGGSGPPPSPPSSGKNISDGDEKKKKDLIAWVRSVVVARADDDAGTLAGSLRRYEGRW